MPKVLYVKKLADWRTYECVECGRVEDLDASEVIDLPACDCGGIMECIDGTSEDGNAPK